MPALHVRRLTGVLFITGAVLVNIPYALLIANFNYPDILRSPVPDILAAFAKGGTSLIVSWLAFAWVGLPMLFAVLRLPRALGDESQLGGTARFFGAAGLLAQMTGLLRWVFVVPVLTRAFFDPAATTASRAAIEAVFTALHQFAGVAIGEHLGQAFTILWMILLSISMIRRGSLPRWVPIAGLAAASVYALAQGELLAIAIPGFPSWGPAGLLGSLMWLGWLVIIGIFLLRGESERS